MIAPRSRLIWWTAIVGLSSSLVAAVVPDVLLPAAVVLGAFLLLVISDILISWERLDCIQVMLPEVVRLTKEREGGLDLDIENERADSRRLRLGLLFPAEIGSSLEELETLLPEGTRHSRVTWPCTATKRGNYAIENVYVESRSAVGFWAIRKVVPCRCEIRVYPNTMREQKNLAALFLNRGTFGLHAQRQVGKGREFEKLREYIPGDSYEDIHWKATAKRGHPITKVFQIERTQEVYVVIDASRLSGRLAENVYSGSGEPGATRQTQLERFITAAMVLGLVAEKQGDLFGFLAFSDHVRAFVRARNGRAHYSACRDAFYALEPSMVNPDFGEICSFIRLRLRRRALLIFLTNLDDPVLAESFVQNIDVLGRHHLVLVNMLTPKGVAPIFSDPSVRTPDDIYKHLGGHILWQNLRELEQILKRRGVSLSLIKEENLCPQMVSQYINVKRRQLL